MKEINPAAPVQCKWDPKGQITIVVRHQLGRLFDVHRIQRTDGISSLVIDTALLRKQRWGGFNRPGDWSVNNGAGQAVAAYRLGSTEKDDFFFGVFRGAATLPAAGGQLWQFRHPETNEIIDMLVACQREENRYDSPIYHATIRGTFPELMRGYVATRNKPQSSSGFDPLQLIGERRKSTPGPEDRMFLTASTVRTDFVKDCFNGVENRVVRDVEIAGPLLRWGGHNRFLSAYYGESNASDVRNLTIYADRMEVDTRLHFPRTNVTIHARELVFKDSGCIDTTPIAMAAPARSKYLTKDPDDLTKASVPADAEDKPTYKAADGLKGEPAGNITLHVPSTIELSGPPGTKRFICRGGKGQKGEPGGLKAYIPKDGYPAKYGPLAPVTAQNVIDRFQEKSAAQNCWKMRWPGEVDWPNILNVPVPPGNVLITNRAVFVKLFAYCDEAWGTVAGFSAWGERFSFPGTDFEHWVNPRGMYGDHSEGEMEGKGPAVTRPCNGRDAYSGGWPGDGGDGGVITCASGNGLADAMCDVGPGAPGEYTDITKGDPPPGPNPAYAVKMKIVKKSPPFESKRSPEFVCTDVSGSAGAMAWARCYEGGSAPPPGLPRESRTSAAKAGAILNNLSSDAATWAHPAAAAAVVNYGRTAYRNGFREQAKTALQPYYALASRSPVELEASDARLRPILTTVVSMRNNLDQNLDYYGNPPGWVPRLGALSNLMALKSVRDTAYQTLYFADKMLSDYESLEDARAVSQLMSDALSEQLDTARKQVGAAYERLPKAMAALNAVQQEIVPVEEQIVRLRKRALDKGMDKVKVQRFVSGALQIAGAIAKSLPVGQPLVGVAGSALSVASEFDWNAEKPLESAKSSLTKLGSTFDTFVTAKSGAVAEAVTAGLSDTHQQSEALVTQLTRQLANEEAEKAKKVDIVEAKWTDFRTEERLRLEEKIRATQTAVGEITTAKNRDDEKLAGDFLKSLRTQKDLLDENRVSSLRKDLVMFRKQQASSETLARLAAKAENAKLKAEASKPISSDTPPTLKAQLEAAKDVSKDEAAAIATRQASAKKVMSQLEGLGSGVATVSNVIISMVTPISEDDPTIKRLAEQMLTDDPAMRTELKKLNETLMGILDRKKKAVGELLYWQQQASTGIATVSSNIAVLTELSRQRQSMDPGLDPTVQSYLTDTKERARDLLAESIYWFVKAYQYEVLEDVDDTFYNFDIWTSKLQELESTKASIASPPKPTGGTTLTVTRARNVVLSAGDFKDIGDKVFGAEQLKVANTLLKTQQKHATPVVGQYEGCVLEWKSDPKTAQEIWANDFLERLADGPVRFNFVRDFGKGSLEWNDARVLGIELQVLELETPSEGLSITIRIEQFGDMVIARQTSNGRTFHMFRHGRHDDPVGWQFVYNHATRTKNGGLEAGAPDPGVGNLVKALLGTELSFKEHNPSLFSDYMIRFTDQYSRGKKVKEITKIRKLQMAVKLSATNPG